MNNRTDSARLAARNCAGIALLCRGCCRPLAIANDNLSWGYTKIRDAVNVGLGIDICRSTAANILNEAGIVPALEREKHRTWKQFMHSHWDSLYACDFFSVETLGLFGAVRYMVVFVVKLETREVYIAGVRVNPDGAWMKQIARGIGNSLIKPSAANDNLANGEVRCRSKLGGLLNFYYREAA